jgi:phosphoglycolate phosphatase-like HAD superfamily hydrolase
MKYQLIVFDWDGTLQDSAGAIVQAIQAACRDLELPVPDDARARHVIGLGLIDAMRHAVPGLARSATRSLRSAIAFTIWPVTTSSCCLPGFGKCWFACRLPGMF